MNGLNQAGWRLEPCPSPARSTAFHMSTSGLARGWADALERHAGRRCAGCGSRRRARNAQAVDAVGRHRHRDLAGQDDGARDVPLQAARMTEPPPAGERYPDDPGRSGARCSIQVAPARPSIAFDFALKSGFDAPTARAAEKPDEIGRGGRSRRGDRVGRKSPGMTRRRPAAGRCARARTASPSRAECQRPFLPARRRRRSRARSRNGRAHRSRSR